MRVLPGIAAYFRLIPIMLVKCSQKWYFLNRTQCAKIRKMLNFGKVLPFEDQKNSNYLCWSAGENYRHILTNETGCS